MARSYKRTPITGCAASSSNVWYRTQENRAKRHWVKQLLIMQRYEDMPHDKEYGNEWSSPRDGRYYFGDMPYTRCIFCRYGGLWWQSRCDCSTRLQEYKEYLRK